MELVKFIVSQQAFWAILGTILGALIVSTVNYLTHLRQRRQQRQMARMRVATDLRHWMNGVVERLSQARIWMESGGHDGTAHCGSPSFRFERSLEQVSLLDHETATKVFSLLHEKNGANADIKGATAYLDEDEILDEFRGSSARLCLDVLQIYNRIAERLKWSGKALSDSIVAMLKDKVDRLRKLHKDRAENNKRFFGDLISISPHDDTRSRPNA